MRNEALATTSDPLHGEYYVDSRCAEESPAAKDPMVAYKLWEISARRVGLGNDSPVRTTAGEHDTPEAREGAGASVVPKAVEEQL